MVIVDRTEIYDEQLYAIAFFLGKSGKASHKDAKFFLQSVKQIELDGVVVDYRAAFPVMAEIENTGADIGTVKTNGDIQTRPIYSLHQIHAGKNAGLLEVEIKRGKGFKKIKVKPAAVTLKGGAE